MRIGIIGGGISGIVAAHTLKKCGHDTVVFEKTNDFGGVWTMGYPGVRLQNTGDQYRISDVPWPFTPDQHPTSGQIREYLNQIIQSLQLDIRTGHSVTAMEEKDGGWLIRYENGEGTKEAFFDFVVVAIGQYTEGKHKPRFPGQEGFSGQIITERDVHDLEVFDNKQVVIVGFGKSAVDMATFAVERANQVYHVFRTPRWLIPFNILGIHYTHLLFCRFGTVLMPCWDYPTKIERFINEKLRFLVSASWKLVSLVFAAQCRLHGLTGAGGAQQRLKTVLPSHPMIGDMRSAAAMAPENYLRQIADADILPFHAELSRFTESGVLLSDGQEIACNQVLLCVGSDTPTFPFFPDKYRQLLEAENDGVQLYRHILHPDIPNVAFAGFNHGFMHVPAAEVGMLWLSAYLNGELTLPSKAEMRATIAHVLEWKRKNINYEPSRSCAVNTRFQQYIDIVLKDLGISPYRKMPNLFAEIFAQYGAADYRDVLKEYEQARRGKEDPLNPLSLRT